MLTKQNMLSLAVWHWTFVFFVLIIFAFINGSWSDKAEIVTDEDEKEMTPEDALLNVINASRVIAWYLQDNEKVVREAQKFQAEAGDLRKKLKESGKEDRAGIVLEIRALAAQHYVFMSVCKKQIENLKRKRRLEDNKIPQI